MTDPKEVADQAHQRAEQAAARAEAARARVEALQQRRQLDPASNPEQADEALRSAELRELQEREAARNTHKHAADALEERAEELAAQGDTAGAERAHERADEAREREHHT